MRFDGLSMRGEALNLKRSSTEYLPDMSTVEQSGLSASGTGDAELGKRSCALSVAEGMVQRGER